MLTFLHAAAQSWQYPAYPQIFPEVRIEPSTPTGTATPTDLSSIFSRHHSQSPASSPTPRQLAGKRGLADSPIL